jgi:ribosomal protein S18 acetylase RimI-like enzyme
MNDLTIRKFKYTDVNDFIRLSKISFAEETLANGITPEDFEQETRKIFRWKMLPYKLLTALMGVKWEAFVAEKNGKVVGGGMYIGRNNRMSITNLMVDPEYRRQGIGQAILVKRLERLSERGFPFAMAQVLETNTASLQNLMKQNFEVFNQYTVYERNLPIPESADANIPPVVFREINRLDRKLFREIENETAPVSALRLKGSAETQYFLSGWQKIYARFTGYSKWIKAVVASGETIGFVRAGYQDRQKKGLLIQPVVADDSLIFLPAMLQKVGTWLKQSGRDSMIVEIPDQWTKIRDYLLENGWTKQFTWLELVRWLDERAEQKIK